ncbi:MAG: hypothetical protein IKU70_06490, partial [Clostridia bacterium]|nr:hypothetical protein [Clostridia bacterium]
DEIVEDEVIEDEIVEDEIVEDEVIEDEIVEDEIVEDEVIEDEIVEDEIVEDEVIEDEIVEDEIVEDEVIEDEIVEDEIVEDEVIEEEIVEDEIVEDEVIEDEIVEDEIVEDDVIEEEIVEDEIVEDEVIEDEIVEDEIVEDEVIEEETTEEEIVENNKEETAEEVVEETVEETYEEEVVEEEEEQASEEEEELFVMIDVDGDGVAETPAVDVNGALMYDSDFDGVPDKEYIAPRMTFNLKRPAPLTIAEGEGEEGGEEPELEKIVIDCGGFTITYGDEVPAFGKAAFVPAKDELTGKELDVICTETIGNAGAYNLTVEESALQTLKDEFADKYEFELVLGLAVVNQASIEVTKDDVLAALAANPVKHEYDGKGEFTFEITLNIEGKNGETVEVLANATAASNGNAGDEVVFDVALSVADGNYLLSETAIAGIESPDVTIVPKALTLEAATEITKEYDGTAVEYTEAVVVNGLVGDEKATITYTDADGNADPEFVNAGEYTLNWAVEVSEDYTLETTEGTIAVKVEPKALTVEAATEITKEYDGAAVDYTEAVVVTGLVGDEEATITYTDADGNADPEFKNAGEYTLNWAVEVSEDYTLETTEGTIVVKVDPKPLTITADMLDTEALGVAQKEYDGFFGFGYEVPVPTITVKTGVGEETATLEIDWNAFKYLNKNHGKHGAEIHFDLLEGVDSNKNYILTNKVVEVEAEIKQKKLTITADMLVDAGFAMTKVYDGTVDADQISDKLMIPTGIGEEQIVLVIDAENTKYEKATVDCTKANVVFKLDETADVNKNYKLENTEVVVEGTQENISITPCQLEVTAEQLLNAGFEMKKVYDSTVNASKVAPNLISDKLNIPTGIGEDQIVLVIDAENTKYEKATVDCTKANVVFELDETAEINKNYELIKTAVDVEGTQENISITKRTVTYTANPEKYFGQPDSHFNLALPAEVTGEDVTGKQVIAIVYDETGLDADSTAALEGDLYPALKLYDAANNVYMLQEVDNTTEKAALVWIDESVADNYDLISVTSIIIKSYNPETYDFQYSGEKGNTPWFIGEGAVTISEPSHELMDVSDYPGWIENPTSEEIEWTSTVSYTQDSAATALDSDQDITTVRTVYLRNSVENSEFYQAIAATSFNPEYKHDPIYFVKNGLEVTYTNPDGGKALTTRSSEITLAIEEESFVVVDDGNAPIKDLSTGEAGSHTLAIGSAQTLEGADIQGNTVTAAPTGFSADAMVGYMITDVAGNILMNGEELAFAEYAVLFQPEALAVGFNNYADVDGTYHLAPAGSIIISGQPDEMITITQLVDGSEKRTFNAVLGADGTYTMDMNELGQKFFLHDANNTHLIQQLNVTYTDKNLVETTASSNAFVYDTVAFPIVDFAWSNRGEIMTVVLPEYGTVTVNGVKVQGATIKNDVSGVVLELPVDLQENNLPKRNVEIEVTYTDSVGNSYTNTYTNTSVDVGQPISAVIEPVLLPNGYFDARHTGTLLLTVTGTAFENVNISFYSDAQHTKLSGVGEWSVAQVGYGATQFLMKGLPQNTRLECVISYEDIDGATFTQTLLFDDHCDKPVITSPVFEEMRVLTGTTEPNSAVFVVYQGERYKAKVYPGGYFEVEMPMLFAGDTFEVNVVDIAYNRYTSEPVEIPQLNVVETQAYPMGKLMSNPADGTWYMATEINPAANKEFSVPVLAGASFEIGTCNYKVENGKVTANFEFDTDAETMTINGVYAGTVKELTDALPLGVLHETAFENNTMEISLPVTGEGELYLITRIDCELDISYVEETYQSSQLEKFQQLQK